MSRASREGSGVQCDTRVGRHFQGNQLLLQTPDPRERWKLAVSTGQNPWQCFTGRLRMLIPSSCYFSDANFSVLGDELVQQLEELSWRFGLSRSFCCAVSETAFFHRNISIHLTASVCN